jgi:hypothetical protein
MNNQLSASVEQGACPENNQRTLRQRTGAVPFCPSYQEKRQVRTAAGSQECDDGRVLIFRYANKSARKKRT